MTQILCSLIFQARGPIRRVVIRTIPIKDKISPGRPGSSNSRNNQTHGSKAPRAPTLSFPFIMRKALHKIALTAFGGESFRSMPTTHTSQEKKRRSIFMVLSIYVAATIGKEEREPSVCRLPDAPAVLMRHGLLMEDVLVEGSSKCSW